MHLMNHRPTPCPSHGLRVHTKKRRQQINFPFLAYEYRADDGSLVISDLTYEACHALMHSDPKRHYYNMERALRYSKIDIFQLLPVDDPKVTRIFFRNKCAVLPHEVPHYMRLNGDRARRAIKLGWHTTCERLMNYQYF